jgi:predicted RNA methylase
MTDIVQFKRDKTQNSNKLHLDKYYTPDDVAKYCIDKTFEIIGKENITEIIEPSAGAGAFSKQLDCIAYDIEPASEEIIEQDFLELDLPYKEGRLIIGNPPYGSRLNLAKAFCEKSFEIGQFVSFILPISQLNNTQSIYKFDLIYSEDLGKRAYTDRNIHCYFNIYKKPTRGMNKRKTYKDSEIIEIRESIKNKNPKRNRIVKNFDYDLAICAWGAAAGKKIEFEGQYVKEFYIKIKQHKEQILELLLQTDWTKKYPMTAVPNLSQWQVYKLVEDFIKELDNNEKI